MNKNDVSALRSLIARDAVPSGRMSGALVERLRSEHLVSAVTHGSRVSYRAVRPEDIASVFASELALAEVEAAPDEVLRSDLVAAVGDSKALSVRSCPGFPVNSFSPVPAWLGGREMVVSPSEGSFLFVCDWQSFVIPPETVVVGVENMENFRCVRSMKWLFEGLLAPVLFVSRYPQSGDLVRWLQQIPNRYLHFGDLDLAGVHIFLTEFYQFLGDRAEFFIPFDADRRLACGSRARYDDQLARFGRMPVTDSRVQYLVDLIHKHHRGYDQEGYIVQTQFDCVCTNSPR